MADLMPDSSIQGQTMVFGDVIGDKKDLINSKHC